MSTDPFPRERVAVTLRRLPAYLQLAWRLLREPLLSRAGKAAVAGAVGYLVSPIDLVPGVIPVLGQLDDVAVALAALKFALATLDPKKRREHLDAVGITDANLTDDLRTVGATAAWSLRAAGRTTVKAARITGRLAAKGALAAAHATARAAEATAEAVRSAPKVELRAARRTPGADDQQGTTKPRRTLARLSRRGSGADELLPVEPDTGA